MKNLFRILVLVAVVVVGIFSMLSIKPGVGAVELGLVDKSTSAVLQSPNGNRTYKEIGSNISMEAGISSFEDILEPGWPIQTYEEPGNFHGGPAIHTLVGDVNGDRYKEILFTGLATGPLYAYDYQGNSLPGYPVQPTHGGASYPVLTTDGIAISANYGLDSEIAAFNDSGTKLWENSASNYIATPPSVGYMTSTGAWGVFNEEEDSRLHGYYVSSGQNLPGWPSPYLWYSQEQHTSAVADIDNDGENEFITASGSTSDGFAVIALNEDSSILWTVPFDNGEVDTFPVVGDVDADGALEVIVVSCIDSYPWTDVVNVISSTGQIERSWSLSGGTGWGTAPALADMNGDHVPEIVVLADNALDVMDGFGNSLPGWPLLLDPHEMIGDSAPVVGDVDGDSFPEVVFTMDNWYNNTAQIYVVNDDGTYADTFPRYWRTYENGAVPAIADIDLDCHNEVIILGNHWDGHSGYYDKVWVFDLSRITGPAPDKWGVEPHGPVQWGQFMSDSQHTGVYRPNRMICIHDSEVE